MTFGLSDKSLQVIRDLLKHYPQIEKCIVFGSRAMGNEKKGSDIDLAVVGQEVTAATVLDLTASLNERLPLPYHFDVVAYSIIENRALREHIDRYGKIFYEKTAVY